MKVNSGILKPQAKPKDGVAKTRNPPWIRDELLLALELYLSNQKSPPGKTSKEVKNLSKELIRLRASIGDYSSPTLRNPGGVYLKMMNFRSFDPDYISQGKVGMKHGGKLDEVVWAEFFGNEAALAAACSVMRRGIEESESSVEDDTDPDIDGEDAPEGKLLTRIHHRRERSRKLVKRKKTSVWKKNGKLICEACSFDFVEKYGERGEGFIECHHTKPVSELVDGHKTKLSDLALVCANCHRMIHAKKPWLTVEKLRKLLDSSHDRK